MSGLSKSRIVQHRQCPKRLWLYVNRPKFAVEDRAVTARLIMGGEVGEVARGLYPTGILIEELDARQAIAHTTEILRREQRPLFEVAFVHDGVFIRADILLPMRGGYRLVEVKSSTSVKEYHLEDAAIQSWVAAKSGIAIKRIEIAHIDNSFVYPGKGDYAGLFTYADIDKEARALHKDVPKWIKAARKTLAGEEPNIEPGVQCHDPFSCPFFSYCDPALKDGGFPPEILPHFSGKQLAAELRANGYEDLRTVPKRWFVNPKHQRVWRVTKKGVPELDPAAGEALANLSYPRYYLDFETIQFAVPIWDGTRPYRQIPFQWSCHAEKRSGGVFHRHFLAKDSADPRPAFIESLIDAVRSRGPILVYNAGFEAGRLQELAEEFTKYKVQLDAIRKRFVDLLPLSRAHYYHHEMRGSWSLKAVLPTIAPDLAYDDLDVGDGGMAQEAFLEMLHPQTLPSRVRELRQALLDYCKMDTLALIKISNFFEGK